MSSYPQQVTINQQGPSLTLTTSANFPPEFHNFQYDLILLSQDFVLFYLQKDILCRLSRNAFHSVLSQSCIHVDGHDDPVRPIPETSDIFDLILHAVYFLPINDPPRPFQELADAVYAMPRYAIDPQLHLSPDNPFYTNLLSFASSMPYDLYALAAQLDIYHLAAAASSHLLSRPATTISDEMAEKIGGVYLKRLLLLHQERMDTLKALLLQPPDKHPASNACTEEAQEKVFSAWAMVAAGLAWIVRPDLSTSMISSAFSHLNGSLSCHLCQQALNDRVQDIITRWSDTKCTI